MTALEGQELDNYLKQIDKQFEEDTAWLKTRGWTEEETWTHPQHPGKRYTWYDVVDAAELDLIHELGWAQIIQHTLSPDYKNFDGDHTQLTYKTRNNPTTGKPEAIARYLHPKSGKPYTYLEAADMARYHNNDEGEWIAAGNTGCGWTQQIQALLGTTKLNKDDTLWLTFGPRNPPTDLDNVYKLIRIEHANT